jgi:hypothetical protein
MSQSRFAGWPRLRRALAALKRWISSPVVLILSLSCSSFELLEASLLRSLSSTLPTESLLISAILDSSATSHLYRVSLYAQIPNASSRLQDYIQSVSTAILNLVPFIYESHPVQNGLIVVAVLVGPSAETEACAAPFHRACASSVTSVRPLPSPFAPFGPTFYSNERRADILHHQLSVMPISPGTPPVKSMI